MSYGVESIQFSTHEDETSDIVFSRVSSALESIIRRRSLVGRTRWERQTVLPVDGEHVDSQPDGTLGVSDGGALR